MNHFDSESEIESEPQFTPLDKQILELDIEDLENKKKNWKWITK